MQVGDKRAHEPRFADAGRQGEADGRELALEIGDFGELGFDGRQRGGDIRRFGRRDNLGDAVEDFQRLALRRAQTQAAGNGVDVGVHGSFPPFR